MNKNILLQHKILNVAIQPKYESIPRARNESEINFHFHIHKQEADY